MIKSKVSPFDSMALEYDCWFAGEGELIFSIELHALQQTLSLLPMPWLEIGVGSGRFAQALGIECGLDPSVELLKIARNRGVNAFLSRGEAIPFKSDVFDAVFLIFTLCFVDSPAKVLAEANRVLSNGGHIVLGSMLQESPWGKFNELKVKQAHQFYKHATFHKYVELEALLMQACFSIEKVVSTLFQEPGKVEHMESPQQGFSPDAGFTVIVARKD